MARVYCKYHRQAPARWRCPACKTEFCPQCVKAPARGSDERLCPLCQGALSALDMGNIIPPFWERLPHFFAYPAKLENLLYISFLSLASLGVFLPLVGLVVPLLCFLATLKYAYALLEHTALGNLEPPSYGAQSSNSLPYKQFALFLLMGVFVGLSALFGVPGIVVAYVAAVFATPASVMALTMSGSFGFAANPMNLVRLIASIGWPYCLLSFFLLLLSGGSGAATEWLLPMLPKPALVVMSTFVYAYFTLIMFHMMGYVLYQYHEALGLQGVKEYAPKPANKVAPKVDELEAEVNILISEGRLDEAKARLRRELRHSGIPAHHLRYHKLLLLSEDMEELARHGKEHITLLMANGQKNKALDVCAECLARLADFQVENGAHAYELAQAACQQGRHDAALRLLQGFAQRYPNNPQIPAAGLLAAKLLCEHKHSDAPAKAILQELLRQYPEHPLNGEIQAYLQVIERLQSVGKPKL